MPAAGVFNRITPAWAGKRFRRGKINTRTRDHPRVGGEKFDFWYLQCNRLGSPPRGRGKVEIGNLLFVGGGITPAWARKSAIWKLPILPRKDHPRVGGEKRIWYNPLRGQGGSPPRGRGKVYQLFRMGYCVGITPAWAGKRSALVWVCAKPWDHPRVGGEKTKLILLFRFRLGSPPRWRGKVAGFSVVVPPAGITPAWAGKSIWP